MSKFLFVVDLQQEFAKSWKGKQIYKKALQYIIKNRSNYLYIYAAIYQQDRFIFSNMEDKLNWDGCQSVAPLEFEYDRAFYHSGYSINEYPNFTKDDTVDVVGFDTDACVLSACFHLFDMDCNLRILTDYIYSSGGNIIHKAALDIMKRQFGKCLIY